jgi:hypothetical protein
MNSSPGFCEEVLEKYRQHFWFSSPGDMARWPEVACLPIPKHLRRVSTSCLELFRTKFPVTSSSLPDDQRVRVGEVVNRVRERDDG